jgi:hypothetical protein
MHILQWLANLTSSDLQKIPTWQMGFTSLWICRINQILQISATSQSFSLRDTS